MVVRLVENPPAEATPDFAYKPFKGFQAAVIEESQREDTAVFLFFSFWLLRRACVRAAFLSAAPAAANV